MCCWQGLTERLRAAEAASATAAAEAEAAGQHSRAAAAAAAAPAATPKLEADLRAANERAVVAEAALAAARREVEAAAADLTSSRADAVSANARREELERQVAAAERERVELEGRVGAAERQRQEVEGRLAAAEQKSAELGRTVDALRAEAEAESFSRLLAGSPAEPAQSPGRTRHDRGEIAAVQVGGPYLAEASLVLVCEKGCTSRSLAAGMRCCCNVPCSEAGAVWWTSAG
jgi:chromosome segregation ATPase